MHAPLDKQVLFDIAWLCNAVCFTANTKKCFTANTNNCKTT